MRWTSLERGFGIVHRSVLSAKGLSRGAKLVYALLCSYANEKGESFPSQETMAKDLEATDTSIQNWLYEVVRAGMVKVKRSKGVPSHNTYIVLYPTRTGTKKPITIPTPVGSDTKPAWSKTPTTVGTKLNSEVNQVKNALVSTPVITAGDELYQNVWKAFISKNDNLFSNYGKEGKATKELIAKAQARSPDLPWKLLSEMMGQFWKLRSNGDKFWHDQPFLPSAMNSLWDRVLERFRNREKEADPEAMAIARGEIV